MEVTPKDGDDEHAQDQPEEAVPVKRAASAGKVKEKVKISFDRYQSISQAMQLHLRALESKVVSHIAACPWCSPPLPQPPCLSHFRLLSHPL
jgi:hypothetical protein